MPKNQDDEDHPKIECLIGVLREMAEQIEFWKERYKEMQEIVKDYRGHIALLNKEAYGEEDE